MSDLVLGKWLKDWNFNYRFNVCGDKICCDVKVDWNVFCMIICKYIGYGVSNSIVE